jgi:hypothetical protein
VIHIGPHKTGTTYLQHAFTRLQPQLSARGVLYPDQWGNRHGHFGIMAALASGEHAALASAFSALHRPGVDTVLLSSETLSYASDADIRRLRALLAGCPVTVVFYCRRWSELLPSNWREHIKHGSQATLPEFVLKSTADPAAELGINFGLVLDRWAAAFGQSAIRVGLYNEVMESGENLLTHFCRHFLGWSDPPLEGPARINESLDMVDAEVLRTLNAMAWASNRENGVSNALAERFLKAKHRLPIRRVVEEAMQYMVNAIEIDDAAPALTMLHAQIAERYRSSLVPPVAAAGLFTPRRARVNYVHSDSFYSGELSSKCTICWSAWARRPLPVRRPAWIFGLTATAGKRPIPSEPPGSSPAPAFRP